MSIFGSFMPGESSGMPTQGTGGLLGSGKLDLGLLGLSLLANNNSKNFGQNLGRAGISAIGMQRQMQQQQAMNDWRKQQQEWRQRQMDMQDADRARDVANRQKSESNKEAFFRAHPEIDQSVYNVDPKLAMEMAFPKPNANNQVIYDQSGRAFWADRADKSISPITFDNQPIIGAQYSTGLKEGLSSANARGSANWKMYDGVDGMRMTERQAAEMANGGGRTMQPPTTNNPTTRTAPPTQQPKPMVPSSQNIVPRNIQNQRDMTRVEILKDEYTNETNPRNRELIAQELKDSFDIDIGNMGIKVPTKAEQAAATEKAKKEIDLIYKNKESQSELEKTADKFLSVANQAKDILDDQSNPPTASGMGAIGDKFEGFFGITSDSNVKAAELDSLSSWLVSNVPRMEGPQSDFDVKNYKVMAGLVGDRSVPIAERKAALDRVIALQEKYKNLDGAESTPQQPDAQPMPEKPSKMTLKRGVVYDTPKGALRWNGQTFEDL